MDETVTTSPEPQVDIQLRRAKQLDIPFITSSWLKSYRDGLMPAGVSNRIYYHFHHKILESLMPRATLMVACPATEPDIILAWACAETTDTALILHYIYTKKDFRKYGIANRLVQALIETEAPSLVIVTHRPTDAKIDRKVKGRGWLYNPYLLFQKLPADWEKDET